MEDETKQLLEGTKLVLANAKELDMAAFWRKYQVQIVAVGLFVLWILIKIAK